MPKPHPEDAMLAAEIAASKEFSAFLRLGPHDKRVERGFTSYEDAKARLAIMVAESSRFGRGGVVYAITPRGDSIPCDDNLVAMAAAL